MTKIYLSPSSQWGNTYSYGDHNEAEICGIIADYAYNALIRCGFQCIRGDNVNKDMTDRTAESNNWGADYHVPIHTNAGGGSGCTVFASTSNVNHSYVVAVYNAISNLTPTTDRGVKTYDDLYEINSATGITIYIEAEFHDNENLAKWIVENTKNIGEAIAKGFCNAEGKPYIADDGTTVEPDNPSQNLKWVGHFGNGYYSDMMEQYGEAQKNNAIIICRYLMEHGFGFNAICGMLGNMMTESYLNPQQWQHGYNPYDGNSRNGMGLVGWTPYWRITDWLSSHGYDINNADSCGYGMLEKLIEECFNPQEVTWIATDEYNLSFKEFATDTTHSIEWLATAFLRNYERPAVGDQPARSTQARKWYEILKTAFTPYTPRLTSGGINGNDCYYGHNPFYQSGYGLPNCTCYAWGRWCELLAEYTGEHTPTLSLGNADSWYQYNINNGYYEYGQTPKLGAIAVWSYDGGGDGGHVAVVEQINSDGSIVTSNSAWGGTFFYTQTLYESEGYEWASYTNFLGFIYFPYEFGTSPIIPTPTTKKKKKKFKWVLFNKNRSVRI